MSTKTQAVAWLMSTPKKRPCISLAEHLGDISHDAVNDLLRQQSFIPWKAWRLVKSRRAERKKLS
jgi:hypothetical protein